MQHGHRAIYVSNQFQSRKNSLRHLRIINNKIISPNRSNAWGEGIIVHGNSGGIEDVDILGNTIEILSVPAPVVGGAIGLIGSNEDGRVDDVRIGNNSCRDLGDPKGSYQVGILVGQFSSHVQFVSGSSVQNFFYGIRIMPTAPGSITGINRLVFSKCRSSILESR
jgi:hypothetical protein